ncbi:hypothetical protein [Neorhizobium alkalisoli]|uniref:hypothetical protein n=1 Tax=Neorhizobium alkalisoli TaxID=528178 RepID=UPI000CF8B2A8|nr:hypothetical protein [Neorhizobium alkalisoli]
MRKIRILIFGPSAFLAAEVRVAWHQAGVELIGPFGSLAEWVTTPKEHADGAVIDLDFDTATLIELTDALDEASIPSRFATSSAVRPGYGGFELSASLEAINAILRALLSPEDSATH